LDTGRKLSKGRFGQSQTGHYQRLPGAHQRGGHNAWTHRCPGSHIASADIFSQGEPDGLLDFPGRQCLHGGEDGGKGQGAKVKTKKPAWQHSLAELESNRQIQGANTIC
jgi:hypothetical protein